MIMFYIGPALN